MKNGSIERSVIALLLAAFLGICATVFATALLGGPAPLALAGLALALCCTPLIAQRLPRELDGMRQARPLVSALWLLLALATLARFGGLALFMADPTHAEVSVLWFDDFYNNHNCFTGYWKASEMLASNTPNIYETSRYVGPIGRFGVDEFMYPPQFLLLPQAAAKLGAGFQATRAAWFAIDALLLAGAMLALCRWIGGPTGRRAALLLPALWFALPTLITLQTGNFQLACLVLAVWAMVYFERGHNAAGGALMSVALFKIFPGILCAYQLFTGRWKALAWTVGFSMLYLGVALLAFGSAPFQDFVGYQLPRMSSGEVWAFLEIDQLAGVAAINNSIPGLVLKLRVLGVEGMTYQRMASMAWVWSVAVVLITLFVARRPQNLPRERLAGVWIALLGLAALRSPFVPDDYALFPAIWLWTLVAASMVPTARRIALMGAAWLALALVMPWSLATPAQITLLLAVSTTSQLVALVMFFRATLQRSPAPAAAGATPMSRVAGARATVAI